MKKVFLLAVAGLFSVRCLTAQSTPAREVGLQFSSINFNGNNSFSAFYKKQKSENVYRRFRFAGASTNFHRTHEQSFFDFSTNFAIGREKRTTLGKKLQYYKGFEWIGGFTITDGINRIASLQTVAGANLVLGLEHHFNDLWALNLEMLPGATISVDMQNRNWASRFNGNISNRVSLGIVRKF